MTKQIAANIEMPFTTSENCQRKIYDKIYSSRFSDKNNNDNRKVMRQYTAGKCNQFCVASKYPILSLVWKDNSVEYVVFYQWSTKE